MLCSSNAYKYALRILPWSPAGLSLRSRVDLLAHDEAMSVNAFLHEEIAGTAPPRTLPIRNMTLQIGETARQMYCIAKCFNEGMLFKALHVAHVVFEAPWAVLP